MRKRKEVLQLCGSERLRFVAVFLGELSHDRLGGERVVSDGSHELDLIAGRSCFGAHDAELHVGVARPTGRHFDATSR